MWTFISSKEAAGPEFRLRLYFDDKSMLYERTVTSLLESLANVGGLVKGVTVVCRGIAQAWAFELYVGAILGFIYQVREPVL